MKTETKENTSFQISQKAKGYFIDLLFSQLLAWDEIPYNQWTDSLSAFGDIY